MSKGPLWAQLIPDLLDTTTLSTAFTYSISVEIRSWPLADTLAFLLIIFMRRRSMTKDFIHSLDVDWMPIVCQLLSPASQPALQSGTTGCCPAMICCKPAQRYHFCLKSSLSSHSQALINLQVLATQTSSTPSSCPLVLTKTERC